MIRIFNHYVSKMAFILLLLELAMLLATATLATALWMVDEAGPFRADKLYLDLLILIDPVQVVLFGKGGR